MSRRVRTAGSFVCPAERHRGTLLTDNIDAGAMHRAFAVFNIGFLYRVYNFITLGVSGHSTVPLNDRAITRRHTWYLPAASSGNGLVRFLLLGEFGLRGQSQHSVIKCETYRVSDTQGFHFIWAVRTRNSVARFTGIIFHRTTGDNRQVTVLPR